MYMYMYTCYMYIHVHVYSFHTLLLYTLQVHVDCTCRQTCHVHDKYIHSLYSIQQEPIQYYCLSAGALGLPNNGFSNPFFVNKIERVKSNGMSSKNLAVHYTIKLHLGYQLRKGGGEGGERERESETRQYHAVSNFPLTTSCLRSYTRKE